MRMRWAQGMAESVLAVHAHRAAASIASVESLEPRLMFSAAMELDHAASYETLEDSPLEFATQVTGIVLDDTANDEYELSLANASGTLYALTSSGWLSGSNILLEGDKTEINDALDSLIYVPNTNYYGQTGISYQLDDDQSNTVSGAIPVTVVSLDDAPVLTVPATLSTAEDTAVSLGGDQLQRPGQRERPVYGDGVDGFRAGRSDVELHESRRGDGGVGWEQRERRMAVQRNPLGDQQPAVDADGEDAVELERDDDGACLVAGRWRAAFGEPDFDADRDPCQ